MNKLAAYSLRMKMAAGEQQDEGWSVPGGMARAGATGVGLGALYTGGRALQGAYGIHKAPIATGVNRDNITAAISKMDPDAWRDAMARQGATRGEQYAHARRAIADTISSAGGLGAAAKKEMRTNVDRMTGAGGLRNMGKAGLGAMGLYGIYRGGKALLGGGSSAPAPQQQPPPQQFIPR